MGIEINYEDVIARLRNGIIYDTEVHDLKTRLLVAYEDLVAIREREKAKPGLPQRYCLSLGKRDYFNVVTGKNEPDPSTRDLYYIDGLYTESKIMAIKKVREIDGCGLREAKDLVDHLQANPRVVDSRSY